METLKSKRFNILIENSVRNIDVSFLLTGNIRTFIQFYSSILSIIVFLLFQIISRDSSQPLYFKLILKFNNHLELYKKKKRKLNVMLVKSISAFLDR
jgi:hypothetical protein